MFFDCFDEFVLHPERIFPQSGKERKEKDEENLFLIFYVLLLKLVRTNGIEPSRCHHHRLLRPARLPVPPRPHVGNIDDTNLREKVQECGKDLLYLFGVREDLKNLTEMRRRTAEIARKAD